jgi:hypothetical protein
MKKILLTLVASGSVAVLAFSGFAATSASAAAPSVSIDKLGTDAMGADTAANAFREYILIQNDTDGAVNVKDMKTRDEWSKANPTASSGCNTGTFTHATLPTLPTDNPDVAGTQDGLWLPKGETIKVYSGGQKFGKVGTTNFMSLNRFNCGLHGHYLNNNNDTVYLYDGDEVTDAHLVDYKGYNFHGGYVVS